MKNVSDLIDDFISEIKLNCHGNLDYYNSLYRQFLEKVKSTSLSAPLVKQEVDKAIKNQTWKKLDLWYSIIQDNPSLEFFDILAEHLTINDKGINHERLVDIIDYYDELEIVKLDSLTPIIDNAIIIHSGSNQNDSLIYKLLDLLDLIGTEESMIVVKKQLQNDNEAFRNTAIEILESYNKNNPESKIIY